MAKKLLPNRSSKTVAPESLPKVRQAITLLNEVMGIETAIGDDEYKSLRKIADKLKRITDDVFDVIKENTEFIEEPLSLEEITKDKVFYELCDQIRVLLRAFEIRLEKEQNIAGAEYFNSCALFESDITDKANRGNAKAQNIKAQLDAIDRNRPSSPTTTKNGDDAIKK